MRTGHFPHIHRTSPPILDRDPYRLDPCSNATTALTSDGVYLGKTANGRCTDPNVFIGFTYFRHYDLVTNRETLIDAG